MTSCPQCGAELPANARRGLCPSCLLEQALGLAPSEEDKEQELSTHASGSVHVVRPDGTTVLLPGKAIGDYELLEEIGHGGMGVIFKARQRSLGREVAVKVLRSGLLATPGAISRFCTEAAAAGRLQHPNIVTVYEVGQESGQRFYSMALVPGQSLAEALRQGPFEPRQAARLMRTVAEAIHFAHQQGVLHRDLKPANILLDAKGEPHVADFGLAKILESGDELTLSGAVIGSPQYMPPEQARGKSAEATMRSDVYALGAILYELLTGRPPFSAATPLETIKLVVEQEPIAPRSLNQSLPSDLSTIALKCLAKEPAARYASALDLAHDLARFLRGEPSRARPISALEGAWRWCRRKPALATLIGASAAAPLLLIFVLVVTDMRLRRERAISQQNLYAADVALASQALQEGDYGIALRSLEMHRPLPDGKSQKHTSSARSIDLRGFEWRLLSDQARGAARQTISAHLSSVTALSYSPDGRWIASTSPDGNAKLWDAASGQLLRTFQEPGNRFPVREFTDQDYQLTNGFRLRSAEFTADGAKLITAGDQGFSAWNPKTGERLWNFRRNSGSANDPFNLLLTSPTDPNFALGVAYDSRLALCLVDLQAQTTTALFTNGRADKACFLPDGKQFARWDKDARRVFLQRISTGLTNTAIDTGDMYISQMAFTPDGLTLVACNLNRGRIELFDVASQQPIAQLTGRLGRLYALAISPDGRLLASGGYDHIVRLWDLAARRQLRQLHGHLSPVRSLCFSPDGKSLVSGGYDGTLRVWDVSPPQPSPEITNVFGYFVFSDDGHWLVTQSSNALVRLWELPHRRLVSEWEAPRFQSAVLSSRGELLIACIGARNEQPCVRKFKLPAGRGSEAGVRSSAEGRISPDVQAQDGPPIFFGGVSPRCTAIALSPTGELVATGHTNGGVALWETRSGRQLGSVKDRLAYSIGFATRRNIALVNPLVFSANGRTLAAASFDGAEIRTWELPDLRPIAHSTMGAPSDLALGLSPNGGQMALGGSALGTSLHLWPLYAPAPATRLYGQQDHPFAVAYSPDGRTLASASGGGVLKLWHLPTQRELVTFLPLSSETADFSQLTFSPDGAWLGASDTAGNLHLFHAPRIAERNVLAEAQTVELLN